MTLSALISLLSLAIAPQADPEVDSPAPDAGRAEFAFLRQNEDWSEFRPAQDAAGPCERLKHIDLDEDGDLWLSLGARLEARHEEWDDFLFDPALGDGFTVSRAIAHADLHLGKHWRLFLEGKTAQATERDLPGGRRSLDFDTLEFQQAFVDLAVPLAEGELRLRPGRQMFAFGAQRLISPLPWGNALRHWDGLSAEWTRGPWTVTGLATVFVPVIQTEPNEPEEDLPLVGVYAQRAPGENGRGYDLYALGTGRPDVNANGTTGDARRLTLGGRWFGHAAERVDFDLEASWQVGEVGDADVQAWSLASVVGWRPEGLALEPRLWVGFDAASGDESVGGDVQTFDQLYPLGHAFLGLADFVARQNVLAFSAGVDATLTERTHLGLEFHAFRVLETRDALYDAGGNPIRSGLDSRDVGLELDLLLDHRFDRHRSMYVGYSHFFPGDAIDQSGPSTDVDFFYVGLGYRF